MHYTFMCSFNEPVNEVVVPEVVHAGGQVTEHEEPLVLVEAEVVFGVVEEVEEGSACGEGNMISKGRYKCDVRSGWGRGTSRK